MLRKARPSNPPPTPQVSAIWWDQNEEYSQFTGDHAFLYQGGYSAIVEGLAEGIDVQLSEEVNTSNMELSENYPEEHFPVFLHLHKR